MLSSKDARLLQQGIALLAGPQGREVRARVARGMELPDVRARRRVTGSVWAVAMVKNEADIIGATIDHLLGQGVDAVLVVDNESTDGTRELLESRADSHRTFVGFDHEPAYFQAPKMRHLARWAARAGADWVVPFDADEWWYGARDTLATTLRSLETPIASAVIHNAFPASVGTDNGWRLDVNPARLEKVAYRTFPTAALHHGNHGVTRPGRVTQALRILHFPWRSVEHFRSKVANGSMAIGLTGPRLPGGGADHWRDLGEAADDELARMWEDLMSGKGDERLEWRPRGTLVPMEPRIWSARWDPDGILR